MLMGFIFLNKAMYVYIYSEHIPHTAMSLSYLFLLVHFVHLDSFIAVSMSYMILSALATTGERKHVCLSF